MEPNRINPISESNKGNPCGAEQGQSHFGVEPGQNPTMKYLNEENFVVGRGKSCPGVSEQGKSCWRMGKILPWSLRTREISLDRKILL